MANSPSLNIPLVDENQAAKEATINTAFLRYEGATQRSMDIPFTANAHTLTDTEFTSYFRFNAATLTADGTLTVPQQIVTGTDTERFFIVSNSTIYSLTVNGNIAGTVTVLPSKTLFLFSDGAGIYSIVVEAPFTASLNDLTDVNAGAPTNQQFLRYDTATAKWLAVSVTFAATFLGLSDTPANYTGSAAKAIRVNAGENGLEFYTPVTNLNSVTDVDLTTIAPTDGQTLIYDAANTKWIPGVASGGAAVLNDLTDVDTVTTAPTDGQILKFDSVSGKWLPAANTSSYPSFTGNIGKVLAVNAAETGVEWVVDQTGGAAADPTSTRWRLYITRLGDGVSPASATLYTSEVEMFAAIGNATDLCTGGTASASSVSGAQAAANAFDDNTSTYWQTNVIGPHWLEYTFAGAVSVKEVSVRNYLSGNSTIRDFELQYWNGTAWVTTFTIIGAESAAVGPVRYNGVFADSRKTVTSTVGTLYIGASKAGGVVIGNYGGLSATVILQKDMPIGAYVDIIRRSGPLKITPESGVTIYMNGEYLLDKNAIARVTCIAANTFVVNSMGNLSSHIRYNFVTISSTTVTFTQSRYANWQKSTGATAVTWTIPSNTTDPFEVGFEATFSQNGAGQVTLTPASGVTFRFPADKLAATRAQWSVIKAAKVGLNEWHIYGDLA